ncbi:MAG: cupredoxin domain-containing protein [Anaerolineae bacterium]|nr:cupredoxin domain-containing protein [Anaerolineae bacterium]
MKKFISAIVLLGSLSLAITACVSVNSPSSSLNISMTDFTFNPNIYTIRAGETIILELVNNGAVEHEFVIMKFNTEVGDNFGDDDQENIYWEAELGSGESGTFSFTAPSDPGEYQIVCGTEGHYLAGMSGSLTIVASE